MSEFINPQTNDQLSWGGCSYATNTVQARRYDNVLYDDFWWVADFSRQPLADALVVDPATMASAEFNDIQQYSDAYVVREFEGIPFAADTFDDNSHLEMGTLQKLNLTTCSPRIQEPQHSAGS